MQNHKTVLITGFKPFLGESLNPSELVLKYLKDQVFDNLNVVTVLLPVVFSEAAVLVIEKIEALQPDYILLLGQAGGRAKISLERVALNWIETEAPDEAGVTPILGPIKVDLPKVYFSDLPLEKWAAHLNNESIPAIVSLSAGGYVCNYLYFLILDHLEKSGKRKQSCFIHLPYLPEQVVNKPQHMPAMSLETQVEGIKRILGLLK